MALAITKSTSRLNPETGSYSWRNVTNDSGFSYEELTVAVFSELPNIYGVQLTDHPKSGSISVYEKVISGLVISSITRPSGSTSRYNFSGSPDLSSVVVGMKFFAAQCTANANNIRAASITAFDNSAKWIEVTNTGGSAQGSPAGQCAVGKAAGFTSVSGVPNIGEYWADISSKTGKLIFNVGDNAKNLIIDYDGGGSITTIAMLNSLAQAAVAGLLPYSPLHISGLKTSLGADTANDISIATGKARDFIDTENMVLGSTLVKQSDVAWAVGTNAGGLTRLSAKTFASTKRTRASNVAKIKIGTGHGFAVGDKVIISGLGGTGYNSNTSTPNYVTLTDVTTATDTAGDSISYANTGSNESVTADASGKVTIHTLHLELIKRTDTGVIDARYTPDLSAGANLPTSYTKYRRIASYALDKDGNLPSFEQIGNRFSYKSKPPLDVDATIGTTATTYGLSHVPLGFRMKIFYILWHRNASTSDSAINIYSTFHTDQALSSTAAPLMGWYSSASAVGDVRMGAKDNVICDSSAQIRAVSSNASTTIRVAIDGWEDSRED